MISKRESKKKLKMNKKVVFIGGGTGLATILKGVKNYPWQISAIVAMTDDGLSTGRIRRDFRILPPGDIRKCLIALSNDEGLLKEIFDYRFARGKGLARHSLGNLLILALEKITGSFAKAIQEASKILNIKGEVLPSTLENVELGGKLLNGKTIIGERQLFLKGMKNEIEKVWLAPEIVKANPKAVKKIKNADVLVIGPGSFYTSIIPNLLIRGITKAIVKNRRAQKIYICNVSTERGETQGFSVEDHIDILQQYSSRKIVKHCVVNNKVVSISKKQYKLGEVNNITTVKEKILGCKITNADVIDDKNPLYHDPRKLAKILYKIIK